MIKPVIRVPSLPYRYATVRMAVRFGQAGSSGWWTSSFLSAHESPLLIQFPARRWLRALNATARRRQATACTRASANGDASISSGSLWDEVLNPWHPAQRKRLVDSMPQRRDDALQVLAAEGQGNYFGRCRPGSGGTPRMLY